MAYQILLLNDISQSSIKVFGENYIVGRAWEDPDAILVRSTPVDTDKYKRLVAVARAGAGVDTITVEKATNRGISVFNTPGANANAVAELVFIMIGQYARSVNDALEFVRSLTQMGGTEEEVCAHIEKNKYRFTGFELGGKTLGVIGLGNIGVRVANRGLVHGMRVVGYDSVPTVANMHKLDARVEIAPRLEDVLTCADILTVHVPLNPSTRHLVGKDDFAYMKRGVVLVNYAREGIYDDEAVIVRLDTGYVRAYLTDFPSLRLIGCKGVICTPHLGASTTESVEKSSMMAAECLRNYLAYGVVSNSVNFPTLASMPRPMTRTRIMVVNRDVPKMIAKMTRMLGRAGVNIQSMANESNGTIGYNIIDIDDVLPDGIVQQIERIKDVLRVRVLLF